MKRRMGFAVATLLVAALGLAEDWKTATVLPAVDFTGLSPAQQKTALKLLRTSECSCGCGMKLAECRVQDPNCTYSRGLASSIVDALRSGKSEADALAAAKASRFAHPPDHSKTLEDPVSIPVAGAP